MQWLVGCIFATIRIIFATKNSPKCFCGQGSALDPAGELSQTPIWLESDPSYTALLILSIFGALTRHFDTLLIIKSRRLCLTSFIGKFLLVVAAAD